MIANEIQEIASTVPKSMHLIKTSKKPCAG
jgi:hypothetical protein